MNVCLASSVHRQHKPSSWCVRRDVPAERWLRLCCRHDRPRCRSTRTRSSSCRPPPWRSTSRRACPHTLCVPADGLVHRVRNRRQLQWPFNWTVHRCHPFTRPDHRADPRREASPPRPRRSSTSTLRERSTDKSLVPPTRKSAARAHASPRPVSPFRRMLHLWRTSLPRTHSSRLGQATCGWTTCPSAT